MLLQIIYLTFCVTVVMFVKFGSINIAKYLLFFHTNLLLFMFAVSVFGIFCKVFCVLIPDKVITVMAS